MSYDQDAPKLGATFVPGGFDDYYIPPPMPEVVAPAPQRVLAELPGQIQDGIAIMELDASSPTHAKPRQDKEAASQKPPPASSRPPQPSWQPSEASPWPVNGSQTKPLQPQPPQVQVPQGQPSQAQWGPRQAVAQAKPITAKPLEDSPSSVYSPHSAQSASSNKNYSPLDKPLPHIKPLAAAEVSTAYQNAPPPAKEESTVPSITSQFVDDAALAPAPLNTAANRASNVPPQKPQPVAEPSPTLASKSPATNDPRPISPSMIIPGASADEPNFSAFPKLKERPSNIPPSDEERELILEQARLPVLNSSDPEAQLSWAQDALSYVETGINHEERMSQFRKPRPSTPSVEHQIKVDAINIVNFLADQQHPRADFMRGMWLEFGKFGFLEDKKEAFRSYKRAAGKSFARAEYRMGMQYESTNEPVKALQHYRIGEEAGDCASCYRMGMMSLLGQHGQPQDFGRAVQLIRFAADHADENAPQGSYVYGMLLARELPQISVPDEHLPIDINGARAYIEKAAYLGFPKAQVKMGSAYELCSIGCEFNPALSMHYQALAAFQGEAEAEMAISKWFLCGYQNMFQKNEELAFKYAQRAASSGFPVAEFAMGYFNEIGMYVEKNVAKALEWYEKAAKNGNLDAEGRIEAISKARMLSKQDHETIAISRIKSRHGSQRGARPERLGKPLQQVPTVQEEPVRQPDISRPATAAPAPQVRPGSVAPYPVDDRPASVAPYPVGDDFPRPTPRPTPAGGFLRVDQRPYPGHNGRPPMAGPYGGALPTGPMSRGRGGPMIRPYGRPSNAGPGRGAPQPRAGYGVHAGYRQPGGPSLDRPGSDKPPGAYNAPPVPAKTPTPAPVQAAKPIAPLAPAPPQSVDIGFSAPIDPRNQRTLPPRKGINQAERPPTLRPDAARTDAPSAAPRPITPNGASKTTASATTMSGALPSSNSATAAAPTPASAPVEPMSSAPQPPAKGSKSRFGLPGKGPKTFEEMGVPTGKHDNDCLVM